MNFLISSYLLTISYYGNFKKPAQYTQEERVNTFLPSTSQFYRHKSFRQLVSPFET